LLACGKKEQNLAKAGGYNPSTTHVMATVSVEFFKKPLKDTVTDCPFCITFAASILNMGMTFHIAVTQMLIKPLAQMNQ
jgi:hypothetical protein